MTSDLQVLLDELRQGFLGRRTGAFVAGVAGGVAAGKTTFAEFLRSEMQRWPEQPSVEIVSTDGFLFSNQVLAEKQLSYRKGFPESYDFAALQNALAAVRDSQTASIPRYSHVTYDIDPSQTHRVEKADVAIVDGLHLGRVKLESTGTPLIERLIYLDASEADLEHWFANRLFPLMVAGRNDPTSFYFGFRSMDDEAAHAFVKRVWDEINLPNLREHIVRDRDAADMVVKKARDHSVKGVEVRASG